MSPGHLLKILYDHLEDIPNWCPGDVPIWRPGDVSKWRPGDVLIWRPRDVPGRFVRDVSWTFSGRSQDVPYTTLKTCVGDDVGLPVGGPQISFYFCLNLFHWPDLSKSNSILKVYLEPSQTSKMELFLRN